MIPRTWHWLSRTYLKSVTTRDILLLNALAVFTGVIAGYGAIGFRFLIGSLQHLMLHNEFDYHLASPLEHSRGVWVILMPAIGFSIAAYLTRRFAPEAQGHGVPEVMEAVLIRGGKIRPRVVAVKALASSITIACGGSVGREGPIVQIGSATGSVFGQVLKLPPKLLKTLVGCGAAGAVAGTFNTPIAGVIFAIEIIILELKTKSFIPLVISSVFATVVSRTYLGNEPAFLVPEYSLIDQRELIWYFGLGILSGLLGVVVIRSIYGMEDLFAELKIPRYSKPIIGGLIVGVTGYFYPQIFGVGYETVSDVLQQQSSIDLILALIFLKIFAVSITLAAGGSGGVFAPSLFIGAMFGGLYGTLVHMLYPEITAGYGAYALVGMAAMFSATGRATFTAIVILFEMTLDYSIILPLMFVCVTADLTAWALSKDSIYSLKLRRRGVSFIGDIGVNVMAVTFVRDIMTTEIETASRDMSVSEAHDRLLNSQHPVYPVVDDEGVLQGVVTYTALLRHRQLGGAETVGSITTAVNAVAFPDETVLSAVKKVEAVREPRIVVVDPKSNKLLGMVSPIDFIRLSSSDAE